MRFRASLAPEQVAHLYALISPLAKVASQNQPNSQGSRYPNVSGLFSWASHACLLAIDEDMMHLALDLPPTEGIKCVASVQAKGGLFLDHRIESQAPDNRIVLRVDLQQLRTALQSIQQQLQTKSRHNSRGAAPMFTASPAMLTIVKLAKRNQMPCLCFEAKTAYRMEIHQTIPVHVLRHEEYTQGRFGLPELPAESMVQLWLPPTAGSTLKTLLDAVKAPAKGPSQHVLLTGNTSTAELRVQLDHDNGAHLQTIFLGQVVNRENGENNNPPTQEAASVRVSATQVASTLNHGLWTTEWSLVPNEALVVAVRLDPVGVCTYVLPVTYLEEEDEADGVE